MCVAASAPDGLADLGRCPGQPAEPMSLPVRAGVDAQAHHPAHVDERRANRPPRFFEAIVVRRRASSSHRHRIAVLEPFDARREHE